MYEFDFSIKHIPRENNIRVDILTCWAAPYNDSFSLSCIFAIKVPILAEEYPVLPSIDVISASRKKYPPDDKTYTRCHPMKFPCGKIQREKIFIPPLDEDC